MCFKLYCACSQVLGGFSFLLCLKGLGSECEVMWGQLSISLAHRLATEVFLSQWPKCMSFWILHGSLLWGVGLNPSLGNLLILLLWLKCFTRHIAAEIGQKDLFLDKFLIFIGRSQNEFC